MVAGNGNGYGMGQGNNTEQSVGGGRGRQSQSTLEGATTFEDDDERAVHLKQIF